jgi:transposase
MNRTVFTAEDLQAIAHDRFHHPHPRVQLKMEVLWLESHALPRVEIAKLAGVSRQTVNHYLADYRQGGLQQVRRCRWHQPESVLMEHEHSLEEYFWDHPPRTTKEAAAIIEQQTGIRRGLTQVRQFLKLRLGLRWHKVAAIPVPPKKTIPEHAAIQAKFLEEQLEPQLQEARDGKRTVFFVDAAHFVWAPFLGCLWCLTRLFVRSPSGRKRYNVLGAVNAVTHQFLRVVNEGSVTAETVCELLRQIAAAGLRTPITLVLDNARYQHCVLVTSLAATLGIDLLYLPSYSPNLNLIERVWRFVRKRSLNSIYYDSFERFKSGIGSCLDNLTTTYKSEVKTLLVHRFQTFDDVPILAA